MVNAGNITLYIISINVVNIITIAIVISMSLFCCTVGFGCGGRCGYYTEQVFPVTASTNGGEFNRSLIESTIVEENQALIS